MVKYNLAGLLNHGPGACIVARILVTNDDGIYSPGLRLLYEAVRDLGETYVVAPETPKSSSGLGITLHKPLRISRMIMWGREIYAINGTPSDIVHVAINEITGKPDLTVAGVNIGDNTSIQVILSSGTVGAAAQAALIGVPAIAFSAAISSGEELEEDKALWSTIRSLARRISMHVLEEGLPKGVDVLNVNFPRNITRETRVRVVRAARLRYREHTVRRVDPRGQPYYWMYGEPTVPEPGTDVYTVIVEGDVALTPLTFDLTPTMSEADENLWKLAGLLEKTITETLG